VIVYNELVAITTGAGLLGSCQKIVGGPTGIPANSYSGILSNGKSNVRISGPGTVDGFGIGVHLIAGDGLKVQDVTVTGPAQPDAATNQRLIANGIQIVNTTCPSPAENVAIIDGNEDYLRWVEKSIGPRAES